MSTFVSTPATLWVVPTLVTAITGRVDAPDDCNVIGAPPDGETLDAVCDDNVVQNPPE